MLLALLAVNAVHLRKHFALHGLGQTRAECGARPSAAAFRGLGQQLLQLFCALVEIDCQLLGRQEESMIFEQQITSFGGIVVHICEDFEVPGLFDLTGFQQVFGHVLQLLEDLSIGSISGYCHDARGFELLVLPCLGGELSGLLLLPAHQRDKDMILQPDARTKRHLESYDVVVLSEVTHQVLWIKLTIDSTVVHIGETKARRHFSRGSLQCPPQSTLQLFDRGTLFHLQFHGTWRAPREVAQQDRQRHRVWRLGHRQCEIHDGIKSNAHSRTHRARQFGTNLELKEIYDGGIAPPRVFRPHLPCFHLVRFRFLVLLLGGIRIAGAVHVLVQCIEQVAEKLLRIVLLISCELGSLLSDEFLQGGWRHTLVLVGPHVAQQLAELPCDSSLRGQGRGGNLVQVQRSFS
mmetsp:Transcript_77086/g.156946  ORF Transcript_77086/g.156946 Transcript_77086/m.156946 type:complete len:406 (-) Transcript_77086:744-1961(-)